MSDEREPKGLTRSEFLKAVGAGLIFMKMGSGIDVFAASKTETQDLTDFPTREKPLIIDEKNRRVLIYTEVHEMNVHQWNVHWGVVFKDGKFQDRAILRAYANQLDFHDALLKSGAKPGNNLSKDTIGQYVEGDILDVKATWPGLGK